MSFYDDVRKEVMDGVEALHALNKKKEAVDQEIRSGNYAGGFACLIVMIRTGRLTPTVSNAKKGIGSFRMISAMNSTC